MCGAILHSRDSKDIKFHQIFKELRCKHEILIPMLFAIIVFCDAGESKVS